MTSVKYIGLDVHKENISICVRNSIPEVNLDGALTMPACKNNNLTRVFW
jgi:hypothetical protein